MPATRVVDVLAEVFRTFGFDTTLDAHPEGLSRTMHQVPLLAEKGGMDLAVAIHEAPLDEATFVEAHAEVVRDVGAYYGLVVTTSTVSETVALAAARHKLILWDRAALEAVIGKAVLAEVQGVDTVDLPIAEVLAYGHAQPEETMSTNMSAQSAAPTTPEPEPPVTDGIFGMFDDATGPETTATSPTPAVPPAAPTPPTPPAEASVVEGRGWYLQTSARRNLHETQRPGNPLHSPPAREENTWAGPVNDPDPVYERPERPSLAQIAAMGGPNRVPRSGGADPRTFNPTEGALLAPAVSKEQAAGLARERIYTIDDTRLRYLPKRVYRWSVECFIEGSVETRTMTGTRLVDLATRDIEDPDDWSPSRSLREGTFDVPVDHKPARLDAERARGLAIDHILERTAREITVEENDSSSDVMMTQKKRVRAHRDDVQIQDEGLHWCPVWCFSGVNGEVEVDALNGAVLGQALRTSTSNTMVL